jgi:hypothetical protein
MLHPRSFRSQVWRTALVAAEAAIVLALAHRAHGQVSGVGFGDSIRRLGGGRPAPPAAAQMARAASPSQSADRITSLGRAS